MSNWLIKKENKNERQNVDITTGSRKITKLAITLDMIREMANRDNDGEIWKSETEWRIYCYEKLGIVDMLPQKVAKTDTKVLPELSDKDFAIVAKLLSVLKAKN